MALYHFNPATNSAMKCSAMISCQYGDLDSAHYDSVQECLDANLSSMPDALIDSMGLFSRLIAVNDALEAVQAHCAVAGVDAEPVKNARASFASLAYKLGLLSKDPTAKELGAALSTALTTHSLLANGVMNTYTRAGFPAELLAGADQARGAVSLVAQELLDAQASMQ